MAAAEYGAVSMPERYGNRFFFEECGSGRRAVFVRTFRRRVRCGVPGCAGVAGVRRHIERRALHMVPVRDGGSVPGGK